jgi:hypothetical protein
VFIDPIDHKEIVKVVPTVGDALIFTHDTLHEVKKNFHKIRHEGFTSDEWNQIYS